MVCFVVTQHSESALSLCLRYSKTSCEATPPKKIHFPKLSTVTLVTQKKSFLETVICYLLFETQNRFQKLLYCYIVTLGDGVIDLSCDIIKNKAQKIWNISLLFVYLQRK